MAGYDVFRADNAMCFWGDMLLEAHAMGTPWGFPKMGGYPRLVGYPLKGPEDLERMVSVDPLDDKYWKIRIDGTAMVQSSIGAEAFIIGGCPSPCFVAGGLRSMEALFMDCLNEPEIAKEILDKTLGSLKMYATRLAEVEGDAIFIDDSTAGMNVHQPSICKDFDIDYVKLLVDHCHSLGLRCIVHNNSTAPFIDAQVEYARPDAIQFNTTVVNLNKVIGSLKGKVCLIPGIDNRKLIAGSPADVITSVHEVMETYGEVVGLVIGPGEELPYDAPPRNLQALSEAVNRPRP
jgi:uroporphyrinogen decarboxylase